MINKLGDDILVEVLIRLPDPKSACRSKLVCKLWGILISGHHFNRRFISHHQSINRGPGLLLATDPGRVISSFVPIHPTIASTKFEVFDCFNDLLICGFRGVVVDEHPDELDRSYLLCNPFTKQWAALPLAPKRPHRLDKPLLVKLVCQPDSKINLDLGDGGRSFVHWSEYRFRVVCIKQYPDRTTKLDIFCSESGKWTTKHLGFRRRRSGDYIDNVVACNGVLFVQYVSADDDAVRDEKSLVVVDPFRVDRPPIPIDISQFDGISWVEISISQGALHMVVVDNEIAAKECRCCLRAVASSVWRLEEDWKCWRKVCEGMLKKSSCAKYRVNSIARHSCQLHPENPEIVFFFHPGRLDMVDDGQVVLSNLGTEAGGELELFHEPARSPGSKVFQPKVPCWPTPIRRYQELVALYDGSYDCWVQIDKPWTTPSLMTTDERRRRIDGGAEQSGGWKKKKQKMEKRLPPPPRRTVIW